MSRPISKDSKESKRIKNSRFHYDDVLSMLE
jgi:hypothetical protein